MHPSALYEEGMTLLDYCHIPSPPALLDSAPAPNLNGRFVVVFRGRETGVFKDW